MKEHWNDMPGDIAGEGDEDLPGGFGTDNPDLNVDAAINEVIDRDLVTPTGQVIGATDSGLGTTSNTPVTEGVGDGSSVEPEDLLEGEDEHPGAGIGFTGAEPDKGSPGLRKSA